MNVLPRLVGAALRERLRVMPAVVVTGARQTGKSTLVEHLVTGRRSYRSVDDIDVLDAARRHPELLVGGKEPVTLDEVQREPAVDFVVETGRRLLPIEIKASARPRLADAVHLRSFQQEYDKRARAGLLLHTGSSTEWLAPGVLAVPWWRQL